MRYFIVFILINCSFQPEINDMLNIDDAIQSYHITQASLDWEFPLMQNKNENIIVSTWDCREELIEKSRVTCLKVMEIKAVAICIPEMNGLYIKKSMIIINNHLFMKLNMDEKQAIVNHEIGHCLGLRHSDNMDNIMFPALGALKPSRIEKESIRNLYFGVGESDLYFPGRIRQKIPVSFMQIGAL